MNVIPSFLLEPIDKLVLAFPRLHFKRNKALSLYSAKFFFLDLLLWGGALLLLNGCVSQKTTAIDHDHHWLYAIVPENKECIPSNAFGHWVMWGVFGNDDGGIFGEKESKPYCPQADNSLIKACKWFMRNPFHNFCFYVIGSADRTNSALTVFSLSDNGLDIGKYSPVATRIFAGDHYGLLFAFHGGKPFVSLHFDYSQTRSFQFYFGWRERGNFGLKFRPFAKIDFF